MPRNSGNSPARPALLRHLNDRTVLELLLADGPTSRGDLAARTGLSKPTVAEVVGRLEDSGLVVDAGETVGRPGPNGRLYDVDPARSVGVGLSVEPRGVRAELVDARGTVLASLTDPHGAGGPSAASTVAALVSSLAESSRVPADAVRDLVVAVPGSYDARADRVRHADRVPAWTSPGISSAVAALFAPAARVTIDNDANLALVAESAATSGDGARNRSLLWLAAGVGLATEIDGHLYRGTAGGAGEVGYLPVPASSSDASSPRQLEFQDLVGASAVLRLAKQHRISARSAADAVARAVAGADSAHAEFLDELATRIALGLSIVVAVLDPGVVVLGGSTGRAGGPELARRTQRALRARSRLACAVVPSSVDGDPVLAGARLVAARRARERLLAATSIPQQSTASDPHHVSSLSRTAEEAHR
jgi:predicted NBD/HSP70 family sugar kinase/biotin operon repressor